MDVGKVMRRACAVLAVSLLAAVPASGAAAAPAPAAAPAAAPRTVYAALGDSYSAGVGSGRDDPRAGACLRTSLAYPRLWASAHPGDRLTFLACSGARLATVREHQVPGIPRDATLVTLTAGGNDVGFSAVVTVCAAARSDLGCTFTVALARAAAVTEVPVELALTLVAVRHAAPQARVVVLGYPHLFGTGGCPAGTPDARRRRAVDDGIDLLDGALARTASLLGARFVDVRGAFSGHGVCAETGRSWINGPGTGAAQYHPTATGQRQGYLAALATVTG